MIIDIRQFFGDSHGMYGRPRIHPDLREAGTRCGVQRVARLMRQIQIKPVRGYKRPRHKAGKPAVAAPGWSSKLPLRRLTCMGRYR
ncbi:MAG: IS3 family transposase [Proteobacteria bacterium]|nr:IS3 family transposase [Pseudomonadota bacterium]MDE3207373.1 IS3 family transposase [Pseudomonadota bacterium]